MAPIALLKILVAPAAKAIVHLSDSLTYNDVPCVVEERSDGCPYLGHVPYFAPKLVSDPEQREQ